MPDSMARIRRGLSRVSQRLWLGLLATDPRIVGAHLVAPGNNPCGENGRMSSQNLIARVWRGVVAADKGEEYRDYVESTGVVGLTETEGNLGVAVLRRREGDRETIKVVSLWPDMATIARFAGEDTDRAVYYPRDDDYLLDKPADVQHWSVEFWALDRAMRRLAKD